MNIFVNIVPGEPMVFRLDATDEERATLLAEWYHYQEDGDWDVRWTSYMLGEELYDLFLAERQRLKDEEWDSEYTLRWHWMRTEEEAIQEAIDNVDTELRLKYEPDQQFVPLWGGPVVYDDPAYHDHDDSIPKAGGIWAHEQYAIEFAYERLLITKEVRFGWYPDDVEDEENE